VAPDSNLRLISWTNIYIHLQGLRVGKEEMSRSRQQVGCMSYSLTLNMEAVCSSELHGVVDVIIKKTVLFKP
jgi:hypothetical protein